MPAMGLEQAVADVVGADHVLTDPEVKSSYEQDWTGRYCGRSHFVVRPGSVSEVAAVMRCCAAAGVAVVPQGGNTGLVGGGVPRGGEVVVSIRRLASIGPVEPGVGLVTVGAGATLAALQEAARSA